MKERPDGRHARMEKYILRKAFDLAEQPYLPEEVLWRQKEQFSDGVGYSWVDGLRDFAAQARRTAFHLLTAVSGPASARWAVPGWTACATLWPRRALSRFLCLKGSVWPPPTTSAHDLPQGARSARPGPARPVQ